MEKETIKNNICSLCDLCAEEKCNLHIVDSIVYCSKNIALYKVEERKENKNESRTN